MVDKNSSGKFGVSNGESFLYDFTVSALEKTKSFYETVKIAKYFGGVLKGADVYDNFNEFKAAGKPSPIAGSAALVEFGASALGSLAGEAVQPLGGGAVGGAAASYAVHQTALEFVRPHAPIDPLEQGRRDWAAAHPNAKDSFGNPGARARLLMVGVGASPGRR